MQNSFLGFLNIKSNLKKKMLEKFDEDIEETKDELEGYWDNEMDA